MRELRMQAVQNEGQEILGRPHLILIPFPVEHRFFKLSFLFNLSPLALLHLSLMIRRRNRGHPLPPLARPRGRGGCPGFFPSGQLVMDNGQKCFLQNLQV